MPDDSLTPVRRQYLDLKARYPGTILFFRMGDFYETFDADAELVARELEIVLTARPLGKQGRIPMAGVPYHAVEGYLAKLIARGYKVAICDQLEDARNVKGIVPRGVVRVVTPGTITEPHFLDSKRNNYLVAYAPSERQCGLAYIDVSTSEFGVTQLPLEQAAQEIERLAPAELLAPPEVDLDALGIACPLTRTAEDWFEPERATRDLLQHFHVATLEGYGCHHLPQAVAAAGAIFNYLQENQPAALAQITRLFTYSTAAGMVLDAQTRRNLELFQRAREATAQGSLLAVLDQTKTAMGARRLRRWLEQPLTQLEPLQRRLDAVEALHDATLPRGEVQRLLARVPDLERLINRVRSGRALPRELLALKQGLEALPRLAEVLHDGPAAALPSLVDELRPQDEVVSLITAALNEDVPNALDQGGIISTEFSPELDALRTGAAQARESILGLERAERERTGIRSLKVGYNKVFGYYLEVSNTHRELVPQHYIRKQTLVGAERFFTPELKEWETLALNGHDRALDLEHELFRQVCAQVAAHGEAVLDLAAALGELDCYAALAEVAAIGGYVRPELDTDSTITIEAGRHPVVERMLPAGSFVPNDTALANGNCQIAVLTGPNMAGKSTYLRQVALIVLMAQVGSFVPAARAHIGLVDRIFTRVGAQDDLATGQSTFMVEMVEAANILHHATQRSLLIFDEIGRGTSTYDGVAIAQAVVEFLHNEERVAAKTLFATHYHELTGLSGYLPRVRNFTFAVAENAGEIVFLRRILPGSADKSYGIHVARLAGLPEAVTRRAEEVLQVLEQGREQARLARSRPTRPQPAPQLPLFAPDGHLQKELLALDLNAMTPLEALTRLFELQQQARKEGA